MHIPVQFCIFLHKGLQGLTYFEFEVVHILWALMQSSIASEYESENK